MGTTQVQAQAVEIGSRAGRPSLRLLVPLAAKPHAIGLRKQSPMVGQGGTVSELHIATEGEWKGHPAGPFKITEAVIDEIVARFETQTNAMMVDYDHKSLNSSGTPEDGIAAGWIHALERRDGDDGIELWALVEWTPRATKMIADGEFKFCSPVLDYAPIDRVSGETGEAELFNVAITNNPFLDGNKPLSLTKVRAAVSTAEPQPPPSAQPAAPPSPQQQQEPAPPAQAQPQQMEQDQARAMNEMLAAFVDAVGKTAGIDRAAVIAALNEMDIADEIAGRVRDHLDADGMPQEKDMSTKEQPKDDKPAAKSDDDRAKEIEARAKDNEHAILLSRVDAMSAELAEFKAERKAEKDKAAKTRIDAMVADGALMESEREDATWMLSNQPERFDRIYASRKGSAKPVPIGVTQAGDERKDLSAGSEDVSSLEQNEIGIYHALRKMGSYSHERAVKSIVARRNKNGAARA